MCHLNIALVVELYIKLVSNCVMLTLKIIWNDCEQM